jgi:hypothetical protein
LERRAAVGAQRDDRVAGGTREVGEEQVAELVPRGLLVAEIDAAVDRGGVARFPGLAAVLAVQDGAAERGSGEQVLWVGRVDDDGRFRVVGRRLGDVDVRPHREDHGREPALKGFDVQLGRTARPPAARLGASRPAQPRSQRVPRHGASPQESCNDPTAVGSGWASLRPTRPERRPAFSASRRASLPPTHPAGLRPHSAYEEATVERAPERRGRRPMRFGRAGRRRLIGLSYVIFPSIDTMPVQFANFYYPTSPPARHNRANRHARRP